MKKSGDFLLVDLTSVSSDIQNIIQTVTNAFLTTTDLDMARPTYPDVVDYRFKWRPRLVDVTSVFSNIQT